MSSARARHIQFYILDSHADFLGLINTYTFSPNIGRRQEQTKKKYLAEIKWRSLPRRVVLIDIRILSRKILCARGISVYATNLQRGEKRSPVISYKK